MLFHAVLQRLGRFLVRLLTIQPNLGWLASQAVPSLLSFVKAACDASNQRQVGRLSLILGSLWHMLDNLLRRSTLLDDERAIGILHLLQLHGCGIIHLEVDGAVIGVVERVLLGLEHIFGPRRVPLILKVSRVRLEHFFTAGADDSTSIVAWRHLSETTLLCLARRPTRLVFSIHARPQQLLVAQHCAALLLRWKALSPVRVIRAEPLESFEDAVHLRHSRYVHYFFVFSTV